jgi:hypothetical protein
MEMCSSDATPDHRNGPAGVYHRVPFEFAATKQCLSGFVGEAL